MLYLPYPDPHWDPEPDMSDWRQKYDELPNGSKALIQPFIADCKAKWDLESDERALRHAACEYIYDREFFYRKGIRVAAENEDLDTMLRFYVSLSMQAVEAINYLVKDCAPTSSADIASLVCKYTFLYIRQRKDFLRKLYDLNRLDMIYDNIEGGHAKMAAFFVEHEDKNQTEETKKRKVVELYMQNEEKFTSKYWRMTDSV